jgi:hypothetical protein
MSLIPSIEHLFTLGTDSNAGDPALDSQNQHKSLGAREDRLSPQSMDLMPHNSSEAHTKPNAPSAAAAHQISPSRYPATYKYLEEQETIIKECEARIGRVKEVSGS